MKLSKVCNLSILLWLVCKFVDIESVRGAVLSSPRCYKASLARMPVQGFETSVSVPVRGVSKPYALNLYVLAPRK